MTKLQNLTINKSKRDEANKIFLINTLQDYKRSLWKRALEAARKGIVFE